MKKDKKAVQEESLAQKNAHEDWAADKFNYAANMDQIMLIQERVQARYKDGTLIKELEASVKATGVVDEASIQSGVCLAMYMHVGFEVGKEAGLHDLGELVNEVFDKRDAGQPKEEKVKEQ